VFAVGVCESMLDLMNQMKSLQVLGSDTLFVGVVVSLLCGRVYCGCV